MRATRKEFSFGDGRLELGRSVALDRVPMVPKLSTNAASPRAILQVLLGELLVGMDVGRMVVGGDGSRA